MSIMAHVMQAAQQACRMKLAIAEMGSSIATLISNKNSLQKDSERGVTPTPVKKELCGGELEKTLHLRECDKQSICKY